MGGREREGGLMKGSSGGRDLFLKREFGIVVELNSFNIAIIKKIK